MYQDAVEANYSHEQMTPLNAIICSSKIVRMRFRELNQLILKYDPENKA